MEIDTRRDALFDSWLALAVSGGGEPTPLPGHLADDIGVPVMFPPGRGRLSTSPVTTGSPTLVITMGMVLVACFAASTAGVVDTSMTSSLSPTNSAARPGRRSNLPSAHRVSYAMFRPSS
jgi:hypothetical protein